MLRPPRTLHLIKQLSAAARLAVDEALSQQDLTAAQYMILNHLRRQTLVSASQMARAFRVSAQAINEQVIGLHDRGLVERKEDANNRRILLLSLTKLGEDTLDTAEERMDELEDEFFESISASGHAQLRKLVTTLIARSRHALPPDDRFVAAKGRGRRKAK
jgi:DNA-binding MarR family transcriptional regulator